MLERGIRTISRSARSRPLGNLHHIGDSVLDTVWSCTVVALEKGPSEDVLRPDADLCCGLLLSRAVGSSVALRACVFDLPRLLTVAFQT